MISCLSLLLVLAGQTAPTPAPEADRAAILAMVGDYQVQFRFEETAACTEGYALRPVYTAEATESVRVIEDRGDFISLQHILVLDAGFDRAPKIVKHWRQDWTWQDTELLEFRGRGDFVRRHVPAELAAGKWSQAVFQVTDQPRYEALGRWEHIGGTSTWVSEDTWRPLPRREATKRDDYQVVQCRNIHTITPDGWLHQQENRKLVLNDAGEPEAVLALERGFNTYRKTDAETALVDFSEADRYWQATAGFWAEVRASWQASAGRAARLHIESEVDGQALSRTVLAQADAVYQAEDGALHAREAAARTATAQIARAITAIAP